MSAFRDPAATLRENATAGESGGFATPSLGCEILKNTTVRDDLRLTMRWQVIALRASVDPISQRQGRTTVS
jgi:hypothetical protein